MQEIVLLSVKKVKKHTLTSIWSAQHSNSGQNKQQLGIIVGLVIGFLSLSQYF